jgi:hypothetical protein
MPMWFVFLNLSLVGDFFNVQNIKLNHIEA